MSAHRVTGFQDGGGVAVTTERKETGDVEVLPARPEVIERVKDPAQTVIVYLERAKTWLVQATRLDDVFEAKSRAAAIEAYIAQKALGKEAELSAAEIVRRAERRIEQLVKEGQDRGEITGRGRPEENCPRGDNLSRRSPSDFRSSSGGRARAELRLLGRASSEDQFDEAVAEAKAEQNLSRANVARKLEAKLPKEKPPSTAKRSSWHYKTRHIDPSRVVRETAIALDGLAIGVGLIDPAAVDQEIVEQWADSIKRNLRTLTRFTKELTHE